ncbi:MAG: hypothetical protein MIO92_12100, partial [Methanosarcinaceae archaeon]|nr:hypothetical protein [Methanosarcinaceae archaeon]
FPSGSKTLSSGTKLVVVCCELAGSPAASNVAIGGVLMTQAANTGVVNGRSASVWYLVTSLSGSQSITGSGGSGRSALDVYEVRGYSSSSPAYTGTATGTTTSVSISASASTNSIAIGSGTGGNTTISVSANQGPAPSYVTATYEGATSHFSWYQRPTLLGTTTFTASGTTTSGTDLAIAVWK